MLNKETVQAYFVEAPLHDSRGNINPLPLGARFMAEGLRKDWLKKEFPRGVFPLFSIGPVKLKNGTEGYSIRMEIVHKPPPQPPKKW